MREEFVLPRAPLDESKLVPSGIFSRNGRCFDFWKKLKECEQTAELPKIDCKVYFEDYLECLHHTKEVKRVYLIDCRKPA